MQTAQLIRDGKSQTVRIPKKYQFSGNKVGIKKIDEGILLYSVDTAWEEFLKCEPISDDFVEAIMEARRNDVLPQREEL